MRKFKNYKLRTKFIYAFSLVALMSLLIGASAIISMWNMSTSDEEMYLDNAAPMADMAGMYDLLSAQRICSNNMVLYLSTDPDFSASEAADLYEKEKDFETSLTGFKSSLNEPDEFTVYNEIESLYRGAFAAAKQTLRDAYAAGDLDAMIAATKSIDDLGSDISGVMDQSLQLNKEYAADKVAANQTLFRVSTIIVCAFLLLSLVIALFEARFLTKLIGSPLLRILDVTRQVGKQGDFTFSEDTKHAIQEDALYQDEIGQLIGSFAKMMDSIIEKTEVLNTVAEGDLSVNVPLVSDKDTIGNAIEKMVSNLNEMFSSINTASSQVSSGSNQIAIGAQQLAQATTEQASTVELLSRNIQDISSMTKSNTELAERAALLGNTIKSNAEQGSEQMQRMTQAVKEINEASQSISTVIKVIDDIAFQTNILALNAAVEAARAGEAGKGFAVVADEVRNLAGKSAEAAKNTSALIEDSVQKAELGARIARETSDALVEIVTGINESSQLVTQIAQSSEEQNNAIADVNNGISQVTEVVQQNSATSEESAAASEEMNSQVVVLNDLVNRFQLR